ncbi:MAG: helix-turn-helix domain-containing protein [Bacteroidota bacterium]
MIFIYKGAFKVEETNKTFQKGDLIFGGQRNNSGKFELLENTGVFGLSLQPYIGSLLFSVTGESILNEVFRLKNKTPFSTLKSKLENCKNNVERVSEMSAILSYISNLTQGVELPFYKLIDKMSYMTPLDLEDVVCKSNLSLRQFQRKFKRLTGYSPTEYLRIARILPILSERKADSLTQVAFKSGFYDQSHFINSFKRLTDGIKPSQYFDQSENLRWIVMGENVDQFQK